MRGNGYQPPLDVGGHGQTLLDRIGGRLGFLAAGMYLYLSEMNVAAGGRPVLLALREEALVRRVSERGEPLKN